MNIVDAMIILGLLLGAALGFKKGVIQSGVTFVGTILAIIIAYMLKNPVSKLMYTTLPFFHFSGALEGVSVLNILIYEGIAFLIVFAIIMALLRILIIFTGIIEKILKFTIVLGIPSKLLGAILGVIEAYIVIFVVLFVATSMSFTNGLTQGSKYTYKILDHTPILSKTVGDTFASISEVYSLKDKYENTKDKNAYNLEALDILLKHEVITKESAEKLVEKGKLEINGIDSVLNKY